MGGGKTRSSQQTGRLVAPFLEQNVLPGFSPVQNETMRQLSEALRTGGIGAGLPIVSQSVSQAQNALGTSLRDTEAGLAASGLARTPYGQRILGEQRLAGGQQIAALPTSYAQQFISTAPQFTQGLLTAILGALAGSGTSKSRGGMFST